MNMNLPNRAINLNLLLISICIAAGFLLPVDSSAQKKTNLLFIMTDQQQYKALSIAGNKVLETPNLDRLAKGGAYFKNAYTPMAVCGPARSSILTGMTVEHTGVNTNGKTYNYAETPVMTTPTFDEILTKNGYQCEYYGKWHVMSNHSDIYKNPKLKSKNGKSIFQHGGQNHVYMDYLNELFPQPKLKEGEFYDTFVKRPYKPDPIDSHYGSSYDKIKSTKKRRSQPDLHGELLVPAEHSITAYQAKETIEAIERLKNKPFSITLSLHMPHAPMTPTKPYYGMYPVKEMTPPVSIHDDMKNSPYKTANGRMGMPEYSDEEKIKYMISNYYGIIKEIDVWIGEILDTLDKNDLTNNTLIIFTSDHGEMLGAHGLREKNVFYEESSHIPLLIHFPGEIKKNTSVDGYVSNVDLFSTILDYLSINEEYPNDGKSLRGLIEGTDIGHGKYVVTEWDYRGPISPNYMIVKGGWKLIIPYTKESTVINAMYDLNTDPHEMNNLIGNNPKRADYKENAEELRACLLEWLEKNKSERYNGVRDRELI